MNFTHTFAHQPRKTWLRRALFQIHLWVGVGVGLYIFVISVTGASLVFREELEPVLQHNERTVAVGAQRLSLDAIKQNVEARHAGFAVTWIIQGEQPELASEVWFERGKEERIALVDPYTGAVLREVNRKRTFFGFLQDLHFYLLAGETGWYVNGIGALLLLALCLTGLVIWWPGVRGWTQRLKVKRGTNWKRVNWDLHNVIGFWALAFVFIWGVTGAYFVFPEPFRAVVNAIAPLSRKKAEEKPQPLPANAPLASLDAMVARAAEATPGQRTSWIQAPRRDGALARVYRSLPGEHDETMVLLHPSTAQVVSIERPRERTTGDTIIRWFGWLHFGTFAGKWSKAFWVVPGLAPALLFVTGFLMWWNRVVVRRLRRPCLPTGRLKSATVPTLAPEATTNFNTAD